MSFIFTNNIRVMTLRTIWTCTCIWVDSKYTQTFVGNPVGRGRLKLEYKFYIKCILKENRVTVQLDYDILVLAEIRIQCRVSMNAVLNIQYHKMFYQLSDYQLHSAPSRLLGNRSKIHNSFIKLYL
jgi:hypothetical protein